MAELKLWVIAASADVADADREISLAAAELGIEADSGRAG